MPNTQEENTTATFASLFGNKVETVENPEEPNTEVETPAKTTTESAPPETEQSATETNADEPDIDEQGRIVVKFDDDESSDKAQPEDVESLRSQIKALLEEKEKLSVPTLDPRIAKLNEYVTNGGEINANFWELQAKDYANINIKDSKDALSVVKDKLKYIEGLEQDEINFFIRKNFPIASGDEEDFDDDDKLSENMKLRMEAKNALDPLKEFQGKVMLPDVDHNKAAETEKAISLYRAESSAKLDEIESFDIELDADTKLKIPFTGAGRNFARGVITDPMKMNSFWNDRYTSEDGQTDFKRFAEEMQFLEDKSRIFNAIYSQGKSAGKKSILEEIQGENGASRLKHPPNNSANSKTGLAAVKF